MSATVQKQLRDLVAARLLAGTPVASGQVVTHSRRPMAAQFSEQVFVSLTDSPSNAQSMGKSTEWATRIRIDCVARDVAGLTGEDAADQLAAEVYRRLMADTRFGGLALDSACHLSWVDEDMETSVAACQVLLIVRHRTDRFDASLAV